MSKLDSETMPVINASSDIPDNMSEVECRDFWDSHQIGEGLITEGIDEEHANFLRAIRAKRHQSVTITAHLEQRVQHIAKLEGISYQRLIEQFVLERTYQEELRLGIVK